LVLDWQEINTKVAEDLKEPLRDLHQLQLDIKGIGTKLDTFIELEKERLAKLAALPPKEFKEKLADVDSALKDASRLGVPPPLPEVSDAIRHNFLAINGHDQLYWQAVAQFLTYRSEIYASPKLRAVSLRNCKWVSPQVIEHYPEGNRVSALFYSNCFVDLDVEYLLDSRDLIPGALAPGPGARTVIFYDCLVKYSGGSVAQMVVSTVVERCLLMVPLKHPPTKHGEQVLIAMLKSGPDPIRLEPEKAEWRNTRSFSIGAMRIRRL
jgi:hypothetical protein